MKGVTCIAKMILIIMGVSGSGKTTIGSLLAKELNCKFYDADDFHSESNKEKMSKGIALTDEDRMDWLNDLQKLIKIISEEKAWGVLACSALKEAYREMLQVNNQVRFVYLKGTYQQIETRLNQRKNHYMPATLLQSQFDALEEPKNVLTIDISNSPETIIQIIRKGLSL